MKNRETRPRYRIRNWLHYNSPLTPRGSLTLRVDQATIDQRLCASPPARRGWPLKYADAAIRCCLLLRELSHLPVRQTQGLTRPTFRLLNIDLPAPHYSLLSRRARQLKQVEAPAERVYGDGGFDSRTCYRAIHQCGARAIMPTRRGSTLWREAYLKDRNRNLRDVRRHGLNGWKKRGGYHRRSLVERAFFRLKAILWDKLRPRRGDTELTEAMIRCVALNGMTSLGKPDRYGV